MRTTDSDRLLTPDAAAGFSRRVLRPSGDRRRAFGASRGVTLVELMIALIVLSVGVLALARLFPAGSRSGLQSRMITTANYFTQEKLEYLLGRSWSDAELTAGRHPAGIATESLGSTGQWKRFYQVTQLASPLDNLKRVDVTVSWTYLGSRSVTATTYVRR